MERFRLTVQHANEVDLRCVPGTVFFKIFFRKPVLMLVNARVGTDNIRWAVSLGRSSEKVLQRPETGYVCFFEIDVPVVPVNSDGRVK